MLTLMVFHFAHEFSFYLKLLSFQLRLEYANLFTHSCHLFFNIVSETTNSNFNFFWRSCPRNYLRESIAYLALNSKLVVSEQVIASYHFLSPFDNFLFEYIETHLQLVQSAVHFALFRSEVWISSEFSFQFVFKLMLHWGQVTLGDV